MSEFTSSVNKVLLDALTGSHGFEESLELLCSVTGAAAALLDLDGSVAVSSSGILEPEALITRLHEGGTEQMTQLLRGRVLSFLPGEVGPGLAFCRMVPAGGEPRNILALILPLGVVREDGEYALERVSMLYSYFSRSHSIESPSCRMMGHLASSLARELILGSGDFSKSVFGRLYDLRLDSSTDLEPGFAFCAISGEKLNETERSVTRLFPSALHLISEGRLLLLMTGVRSLEPIVAKLHYVAVNYSLTCGVSSIFEDLIYRTGFRRQAIKALDLASPDCRVVSTPERYIDTMLSGALEQVGPRVLILSEVHRLADYDEHNHTDYLSTLEAYLAHANRLSAGASSMFVDRSTMKYRLQKISDIIGLDVDDADIARRLRLGIAVYRLQVIL